MLSDSATLVCPRGPTLRPTYARGEPRRNAGKSSVEFGDLEESSGILGVALVLCALFEERGRLSEAHAQLLCAASHIITHNGKGETGLGPRQERWFGPGVIPTPGGVPPSPNPSPIRRKCPLAAFQHEAARVLPVRVPFGSCVVEFGYAPTV